MKNLIAVSLTLLSLILAQSIHASILVRDCTITAKDNNHSSSSRTINILLSKSFLNKVSFYTNSGLQKTELKLQILENEQLQGWVNDQFNFIIDGTASEGSFQGAYHTGIIQCGEEKPVPSLLKFKPWELHFTKDPVLSKNHLLPSINLDSIRYGYMCFIGDATHASDAVTKATGVKGKVVSQDQVDFIHRHKFCEKWIGSNQDNYECTKYGNKTVIASLRNCEHGYP